MGKVKAGQVLSARISKLTQHFAKPALAFDFVQEDEFDKIKWNGVYRQVGGALCGNLNDAFEVLKVMCPTYRIKISGPFEGGILSRWTVGVDKMYTGGSGPTATQVDGSELSLAILSAALEFAE